MNVASRILKAFAMSMLMALPLLFPLSTLASDHGAAGGAPEPMIFTVNLGRENYLQFGLVFETASPEAAHLLAANKPRIQHKIILMLSDKESTNLRTLEGKKALIAEIIELANQVIDEDEKTGIKEVLFTKFLIQ
ncbi:MAG: Flagellar basal body-associated protein FliL [Proteobacteria bacterium]|uniref:Flagellar protein FliL n=1 Tax=Dechloromonas aromatica (strain RCB) TaxID=159087 RepID=Q47EY9_DECAR|nr:Flagellar basal body-associated protein FliL [Pseudomonadota bacterium]